MKQGGTCGGQWTAVRQMLLPTNLMYLTFYHDCAPVWAVLCDLQCTLADVGMCNCPLQKCVCIALAGAGVPMHVYRYSISRR